MAAAIVTIANRDYAPQLIITATLDQIVGIPLRSGSIRYRCSRCSYGDTPAILRLFSGTSVWQINAKTMLTLYWTYVLPIFDLCWSNVLPIFDLHWTYNGPNIEPIIYLWYVGPVWYTQLTYIGFISDPCWTHFEPMSGHVGAILDICWIYD